MTLGKLKDVASTHASAIISVGIFFPKQAYIRKIYSCYIEFETKFLLS